jgi:hypothetical protein
MTQLMIEGFEILFRGVTSSTKCVGISVYTVAT